MYNESFVNQQINSISKRSGVALDIGANHGMHTPKIAEKFEKVFALEPHPSNVTVLKNAVKNSPNVLIKENAITETDGPIKLYNCSANPGGHTLSEGVMGHKVWGHKQDDFLMVEGLTLDSFVKHNGIDHVSFMKVDIEGAENTAFLGAIDTLKNHKMDIVMEVHRFVDCDALFKLFTDLGYKIYDIDGIGRPTTFVADNHYILSNRHVGGATT